MGYMARSYGQAFHSFAWLQAVQKKPLVACPAPEEVDEDEVEHAVDDASDGEKEEGEIEEGEAVEGSSSPPRPPPETIDLDSDAPEKSESVVAEGSGGAAPVAASQEVEVEYDQRVGSILEELEMISIEEAEKYGWMLHVFVEGWLRLRFWMLRKTSFRASVLQVVRGHVRTSAYML